jgi:hypothetical protein
VRDVADADFACLDSLTAAAGRRALAETASSSVRDGAPIVDRCARASPASRAAARGRSRGRPSRGDAGHAPGMHGTISRPKSGRVPASGLRAAGVRPDRGLGARDQLHYMKDMRELRAGEVVIDAGAEYGGTRRT